MIRNFPLKKISQIAFLVLFFSTLSIQSNAQLVANFSAPNSICAFNSVGFNDLSTGGAIAWFWDFPGGSPAFSVQQNPIVTYNVPGNYNVQLVVYDGSAYDTLLQFNYINVMPPISTSWTTIDPTCGNNNGAINIVVTGGISPYTYSWSNGSITANQSGLFAGTYTCFIADAVGCTSFITVVLTGAPSFSILESHTDAACGNADGAIDLTPMGGTPPFNFQWSNSAVTEDLNNINAGVYDVTVTDANSCLISLSVVVNNTNGPVISPTILNAVCGQSNGSIDLYVVNGTAPYTFLWSNGETTSAIDSLPWGNYTVTVSDQNLCQGFSNIAVYDSNLISVSSVVQSISCGTHGNISVNASGGVLPYTYLWNTGDTTSFLQNVSMGNYTITISDAGTCTLVTPINAQFYFYTFINETQPNCSSNGELSSVPFGGVPPFTYLWSNGGTDSTITNLSAGTYFVTVTDSAGCETIGYSILPSSCVNVIEGNIFHDLNGNCIQDSGEVAVPNITVTASGSGGNFYGYSDFSGNYHIEVPFSGSYFLSGYSYGIVCGSLSVCNSPTIVFPSVGDSSLNNTISYQTGSMNYDLLMHPGWHTANPGFDKEYWILYYNDAPVAFSDTATVVFHYDSNLIYFDSIAPFPIHDAVAHTLTWQFTNVPNPVWSWNDRLHAFFHVPASLPVTYQLQSYFDIYPLTGDCNNSNNHLQYSESVLGSLDPNEKEVSPAGFIFSSDSILTYTIHFQNTGTDTTHFVIVKDTLSSYLNPATVENIASSDPYSSFNISGTGVLTWIFNPLFLPDSSSNSSASKGFVSFSVKLNQPLIEVASQIENKASIYFDYNPAVITNTVTNTVIDNVDYINKPGLNLTVSPNPFTDQTQFLFKGLKGNFDFKVENVLGEKIISIHDISTDHLSLKRSNLSSGIYFCSLMQNGEIIASAKLMVQ